MEPVRPPEQLRFTGTGSEYFGIWIVNLLLTVLTLGIYSAWAKVRRLQYFYRHTELAGSSFDFHGSPARILVGRILALVLFGLYNYSARLQSVWTLVVLAALAIVMPWLLRNSFRFRLYNASWRGTRFHFRGSVVGAYRVFLLNGLLVLVSSSVLTPFAHQRLKAYQHGNSWFGQTRISFHARVSQFYRVYFRFWLILVGILGILATAFMLGGGSTVTVLTKTQQLAADSHAAEVVLLGIYAALILMVVVINPIFQTMMTNLIWNNTRVGDHRMECRMSPWVLIWISVSNLLMVVISLGLFIPWATVRRTRYQVESISLVPATDLQEFVDAEPEAVGALGEEAAAVFDFDIAL
jgi:uncharacterized membrane protein YjgN (DUF898 family)